jgi:hypothetical protein
LVAVLWALTLLSIIAASLSLGTRTNARIARDIADNAAARDSRCRYPACDSRLGNLFGDEGQEVSCRWNSAQYSEVVKSACKNDYKRFCSIYALDDPGLRKCMDKAGPSLSQRCVAALVNAGEVSYQRATQRWGTSSKKCNRRPGRWLSALAKWAGFRREISRARALRSLIDLCLGVLGAIGGRNKKSPGRGRPGLYAVPNVGEP